MGSAEWGFKVLAKSDERASQEVSRSERKEIKLLVKSPFLMSCNLTNSAIRVWTRVHSNSLMPPFHAWSRDGWHGGVPGFCMQYPRLSPPSGWSLWGVQLHCYPPQLEETLWEQVLPLGMLLLPPTLPPIWHLAAT